ncbi:hypothetical protein UA08_00464 [Talaromyces atroroseus]|uniref:Uncharacterized protein n=1 Tax=Talaromyces atroroseus TaxID=1441469 RepID=A0A225BEN9_TALAT|nr:hypothetical protein UA08_00464 [Talaromyces atroroseus]OKL64507.1 hypothetical protein UA08_00464 [Talaromyces atroroseus]
MEARALAQLLDEENHSVCLYSNSLQLLYLALWADYLLILRFFTAVIYNVRALPESLHTHIIRVESRIVNIAISIVQIVPGGAVAEKYRRRCSRDDSLESSLSSTDHADDLLAPRDSSLDSSGVPDMFLHQPDIAYLRPQAPRPPYRRHLENSRRPSSIISPLQPAVTNPRRNMMLDGTVSPPAFIEPIPRTPMPPIPTFIARMPLASVSDSIYSSCSTQLHAAQCDRPVNTSLERRPSAEAQTYADLLPKRSFDDANDPHPHSSKASPSSNTSPENPSSGNTSSHSDNFPLRFCQDLEHNTLAAMAQRYARIGHRRRSRSIRSSSAPIPPVTAKELKP